MTTSVMIERLVIFPLLLILPCIFILVIHAYVKIPTGAALGTWLMLTILGVELTFWSFLSSVGIGHGRGGLGLPIRRPKGLGRPRARSGWPTSSRTATW